MRRWLPWRRAISKNAARPAPPPARRRRRFALRAVAALLIVLVALAGLWLTGWPQRAAVEHFAGRALDARVEVRGLRLRPGRIRVAELALRDENAPAGSPHFLRLAGISLDYAIAPDDGRRLRLLRIRRAEVHADARDPNRPNFAFFVNLLKRPRDPDKKPSLQYVPREVQIGALAVQARLSAMQLDLQELRAGAFIPTLETVKARLLGEGLTGRWRAETYAAGGDIADGRVDVTVLRTENGFRVEPLEALLPGFLELRGAVEARLPQDPGRPRTFDLRLDRCVAQAMDFTRADPAYMPFPLRFAYADLSGTRVQAHRTAEGLVTLPELNLAAVARDLALGPAGHEWYEGDLQVTGSGEDRRYQAEAVLGQGQQLTVSGSGTLREAEARFELSGWTRDQVLGVIPIDYRRRVEAALPVEGLSAGVTVTWNATDYTVEGAAEPRVAFDGKEQPVEVAVKGGGAFRGAGTAFRGTVSVAASGKAVADVALESVERFTAAVRLDSFNLRRWQALVPALRVPPRFLGPATGDVAVRAEDRLDVEADLRLDNLGTRDNVAAAIKARATAPALKSLRPLNAEGVASLVEAGGKAAFTVTLPEGDAGPQVSLDADGIDAAALYALLHDSTWLEGTGAKVSGKLAFKPDGEGYAGSVDATVAPTPLPQVLAPPETPLAVEGKFRADSGFRRITGPRLTFASGDDVNFQVDDWSVSLDGPIFKGTAAGVLPANRLAPLRRIEGFEGVLEARGPVRYADGTVTAAFEATGEEFGLAPYTAPPGTPLEATGKASYDVNARTGRLTELAVEWSGSARMVFEPLAFSFAPRIEPTPFTLETDLVPLTVFGLVPEAEGRATASGRISYADGAFAADAEYSLEAPLLVLPAKAAALTDVTSQGRLAYEGGLKGDGRFGAASVTAGGATVRSAAGPFTLANGVLKTSDLRATLWEGALRLDGQINLTDERRHVQAHATVENLDLAAFTAEYKPPKAQLAGIAGGEAGVEWSRDGFQDLSLDLEAPDGLTMNRDLVYQLLLSEYIRDAGPGRRVDRIVNEVVGEAPQRPFKSAAMELGMGGGERITGEAVLNSERLNLVIEIKMDPKALEDLLRLRQENRLEDISRIQTSPAPEGE